MAKKYRIKLLNGRIVGPFDVAQIAELFVKGHLKGKEPCQVFPGGDWKTIGSVKELKSALSALAKGEVTLEQLKNPDATSAFINLSKLKEEAAQKEKEKKLKKIAKFDEKIKESGFVEFDYKKNEQEVVDYEEIEKNYQEKAQEEKPEEDEEESGVEATRIVNINELNLDKTRIVNLPQKEEKEEVDNEELEEEEEVEPEEVISTDDKTEFFQLDSLLPEIQKEAKEVERDIKQIAQESRPKPPKAKKKKEKEEEAEEPKKQMKPIVAIAFIVVLYFLIFDEDEKSQAIKPMYLNVVAPTVKEYADEQKSINFYKKGLEYYGKQTYIAKLHAANMFKQSLEESFSNNPSLGYLILTYADLFDNVKNKEHGAMVLFNLIETGKSKILTDAQVARGSAIFYLRNEKYLTSLKVIENYLRVNKPDINLICLYIDTLVKAGKLSDVQKAIDKARTVKLMPLQCYQSIVDYYLYEDRTEDADKVLKEGLSKYPGSVALLLQLVEFSFQNQNWKRYIELLKEVHALKAEQSPVFYSRYLQYMGILSARNKDNKVAAQLFTSALKLIETDQLRSLLSSLELGGTKAVENLILESKIIDLMKKSKEYIKKQKWEKAFNKAIEAADYNESYIPAQLLLAEIQIQRGYFETAISNLVKLKKEYPLNMRINSKLISAYVEAYKLEEANLELNLLSTTKSVNTPEYASLLARYYDASNRTLLAIQWYREAISRNPLNDKDYYRLAKLFFTNRKYHEGKKSLIKAINLDPANEVYHSLYAESLYDLEGADIAIGYLRKELESNKDSAKLLGEIAIYYYKEGKQNEFLQYKERIEKLNNKDASFYEFLIETAKLEENFKNVIKYGRELIKFEPGNIRQRMTLADYLMKENRFTESLEILEGIRTRLKSYPKVQFLIAKAYLLKRNYKQAIIEGEIEIKNNPALYHGYYIVGEAYRLMGNIPKAVVNLEKAISKNQNEPAPLMALGWIKHRQNYHESAREYYARALKFDEANPEIRKQLGYIYRAIGQGSLALEEFKVYLKLNPAARDRRKIEGIIRQLK